MIKSLSYRLKRGDTVTLQDLSSGIIALGPNGSGKTAFTNAIQLPLSGKALDVGLRDSVAAGSRRSAVLATTADAPFAEIDLGELGIARWEQGEKLSWSGLEADVAFLWQEAEAMVAGGATTAVRFFVNRFSPELPKAPLADDTVLNRIESFEISPTPEDNPFEFTDSSDLLAAETKVAKVLKGHKDRLKALTAAMAVVKSCRTVDNADGKALMRPLAQIMGAQLTRGKPNCITCGEDTDEAKVTARLAKVTKALPKAKLPSASEALAVAAGLQLEAESVSAEVKVLDKVLKWIQSWMEAAVKSALPSICDEINSHLPEGFAFRGAFHGRQFLAGFRDGEDIRMGFSGGEGQLLLAAICAAVSIRVHEEGGLPVTMTGDRWLDEDFLRHILGALQGAQGLRVVTAVKLKRGRPPGGWSICKFPLG